MNAKHKPGTIRWTLAWLVITLIACELFLTEAARADGFYLHAGLSAREQLGAPGGGNEYWAVTEVESRRGTHYQLTPVYVPNSHSLDVDDTRNPYGSIGFGYDYRWRAVLLDFQLKHESSIDTGRDRGINSVSLSVRWYPLGGR